MFDRLKRLFDHAWAAEGLALLGAGICLLRLWLYAHSQASVLDEGLYLYKGFLFVSGRYVPFQDYGPLTNQMPLAFFIPGLVQLIFGLGLRTGRYFAIVLAMLMVMAGWLTVRRFSGRWLAAGLVWVLALNTATLKLYSLAISEGLVACLLMWTLALTLGEGRRLWQIGLGAFLAGILIMIRINLLPLLPLLCLYVFWQHGKRAGLLATVISVVTVGGVHAGFWPNILRLWAYWLPAGLTPFLNAFRPPFDAAPSWDPNMTLTLRLFSLFDAVRYHFVAVVGALASWLLWPRRAAWRSQAHFRAAVFLSALFALLVAAHAWASLGKNYCVFCFPVYFAFFSGSGLLLTAISLPSWQWRIPRWRQWAAALIILLLATGIGFAGRLAVNDALGPLWVRDTLNRKVPRIQSLQVLEGQVRLWELLGNKFHTDYETLNMVFSLTPATFFGLLAGAVLLLAGRWRPAAAALRAEQASPAARSLALCLAVGFACSWGALLGGGFDTYDCSGDVLAAYEAAGAHLAAAIPPGAKIYWRGGTSPVPLLYLPAAQIYPPQLNWDYSFRLGGDPDALLRYGWWSEPLARRWAAEADVILIEDQFFAEGWLQDTVLSGEFAALAPTAPVAPCRPASFIRIFRRLR